MSENFNQQKEKQFSKQRQILMEKQIRRLSSRTQDKYRISQRSDVKPPSLSFAQNRLWFLDQYDPGNTAYNILSVYHLHGKLNIIALKRAFNEVIRRHEGLRTTFKVINDKPVQWIAPHSTIEFPTIDLHHINKNDRFNAALSISQEERIYKFNLDKGPLIRLKLIQLDTKEFFLIINIHHIVTDGWSNTIFRKEISDLYNSYVDGYDAIFPEITIQYADFSEWQRHYLKGEVLNEQLNYWRNKLNDIPSIDIPLDFPRPANLTYNGAHHKFSISRQVTTNLKRLSSQEKSTLFMTLLSAYIILLQKYTGQEDIVVGTSIANRNHPDIENIIGFFVNTLVIRSDLTNNPTFRDLLHQIRHATLDSYSYQDFPFEKLVEELQPERDLRRNPFFQTTFLLQNIPPASLKLSDVHIERVEIPSETAKFDLSLTAVEGNGIINVWMSYNTNLFLPGTIKRIGLHFQNILELISNNPDAKIGNFPILSKSEYQEMIFDLNNKNVNVPKGVGVHTLFENCAERTPDEICIVEKNEEITYQDLNQKANKLAQLLIDHGIAPERTVGIFLDRSITSIICIMAVLKTGGVYLSLDTNYPKERLGLLLNDSDTKIIITSKKLGTLLPQKGIHQIYHDEIWENPQQNFANPKIKISQENLAYIMYTSGSTGKPKGVMISHRNILGFLFGYKEVTLDGPRRIGTTVSPFNFDNSIDEIFSTICFGGTLHIIQPENLSDGHYFANYIIDKKITTSYILPDFLKDIADNLISNESKSNMKCLITGLAPKKESILQTFRNKYPTLRILNAYGPTEVTYGATAFKFDTAVKPDRDVPIGVPYPNYQTYIVDRYFMPVPIGVTGELLIGGTGVSRGYLNKPSLSAEKFIPDPFSGKPGGRLYRTGDLVRFLPDGNIEFLGRDDLQVKIRGYRIELGEIESTICNFPGVNKAVVTVHNIDPGDIRLVAYVEAIKVFSSVESIRDFLNNHLPKYMVPNFIIILDELPMLSNGKVNRRALPEPEMNRDNLNLEYIEPRNDCEKLILGIWKSVLEIETIGVQDDFFDLGGHSLMATQIVSRIRNLFGIDVSLRTFFEGSTIGKLSNFIMSQPLAGEKILEIIQVVQNLD